MIRFFSTDDICRQRYLLNYFGEESDHDCDVCDVCIARRQDRQQETYRQAAEQAILDLLSDHKPHHITELKQLNVRSEILKSVLDHLLAEEILLADDSYLTLSIPKK